MKEKTFNRYKRLIEEALNDLKTPGRRIKQLPNILTTLRLLAPLIIIPTAATGNIGLTIIEAAVFGLTDLADGQLARKLHLQSELGATLDAFSDKLFAGTLLIAASIYNPFLLVNLGLEASIAGVNICAELNEKKAKSNSIGKIKTWFVFVLGILGIVSPSIDMNYFLPTLASLTALMQGATLTSYIDKYKREESKEIRQMKKEKTKEIKKEQEKLKVEENKHIRDYTYEESSRRRKIESLQQMRDFIASNENKENSNDKEKIYKKK